MVSRRTLTALAGLVASIIITVVLSVAFDAPIFLLVLPFIPILGWRHRTVGESKTCPTCQYRTTDEQTRYCPRDGTPLETE